MKKTVLKIRNFVLACVLTLVLTGGYNVQNACCASDYSSYYNYAKSTVSNDDMEQYVAQARRRIKGNWYPPSNSFEHAATIVLTINKDGQLQNCYLSSPSSDEGFNESLINAAKKTIFPPLPEGYRGKSIDIDLDFSMHRRSVSK